jgi:hypothetical protein
MALIVGNFIAALLTVLNLLPCNFTRQHQHGSQYPQTGQKIFYPDQYFGLPLVFAGLPSAVAQSHHILAH